MTQTDPVTYNQNLIASPHMNDRLIENLFLLNNSKINTLIVFGTHNLGAAQYILEHQN